MTSSWGDDSFLTEVISAGLLACLQHVQCTLTMQNYVIAFRQDRAACMTRLMTSCHQCDRLPQAQHSGMSCSTLSSKKHFADCSASSSSSAADRPRSGVLLFLLLAFSSTSGKAAMSPGMS